MKTSYSPPPVDRSTRIFWKYSASGRIRLVVLMPVSCSNCGRSGISDSVNGCLFKIIRTVLPLYFCQSNAAPAAAVGFATAAAVGAAAGAVVAAAAGAVVGAAAGAVVGLAAGGLVGAA